MQATGELLSAFALILAVLAALRWRFVRGHSGRVKLRCSWSFGCEVLNVRAKFLFFYTSVSHDILAAVSLVTPY